MKISHSQKETEKKSETILQRNVNCKARPFQFVVLAAVAFTMTGNCILMTSANADSSYRSSSGQIETFQVNPHENLLQTFCFSNLLVASTWKKKFTFMDNKEAERKKKRLTKEEEEQEGKEGKKEEN